MASGLLQPGDGSVAYNGHVFSQGVWTEEIDGKAELDTSKRTIKWVRWRITLVDYLYATPPATIDTQIQLTRRQLMSQAGAFTYISSSFGTDLNINVPGGQKWDLNWGPKVIDLNVKKIGNNYAARIRWTVEVCIPECGAARFQNTPVEFCYSWRIDKDTSGYTTRAVKGHISIAQTRQAQGIRFVRQNADQYLEKVRPLTPAGFRPGPDTFEVSEDRNTLNFAFVDKQLPSGNTFPPGVVDAKCEFRWENAETLNFVQYIGVVSADYTMAPGITAARAFNYFLNEARDSFAGALLQVIQAGLFRADPKKQKNLIQRAQQEIIDARNKAIGGIVNGAANIAGFNDIFVQEGPDKGASYGSFIPLHFVGREPDKYGPPRASFTIAAKLSMSVAALLVAGLWRPVPEAGTWPLWAKSLADTAFNPRGQAGLTLNPQDDIILDPCFGQVDGRLKSQQAIQRLEVGIVPGGPIMGYITPASSWLGYECNVEIQNEQGIALHTPIPQTSKLKTPAALDGLGPFGTTSSPQVSPGRLTTEPNTIVQNCSAGVTYLTLSGAAIRAGWEVSVPTVVQVGDAQATLVWEWSKQKVIANCGLPVFGCSFKRVYVLNKNPGDVATPPHPFFLQAAQPTDANLDNFIPSWEN